MTCTVASALKEIYIGVSKLTFKPIPRLISKTCCL